MTLFYDTRIRPVVVERWPAANITNMSFASSDVPDAQVDPEDSALLKDTKIALSFKNQIAQELYDAEEEGVKEAVRSKRQADLLLKTAYNVSEEDRLELIREYQK